MACAIQATLLCVGCDSSPFSKPESLGGKTVSVETLNRGYGVYRRNCVGCHGVLGDGEGSAASGMKPAPRDFTRGQFKYSSTPAGSLPVDQDLIRTVRRGLKGTHMAGWSRVSDADVQAVVEYIKTFSPRWKSEVPASPVQATPDPWLQDHEHAVERGKLVYHGAAQCWTCHPAYASRTEIQSMTVRMQQERGEPPAPIPWRASLHQPREVMDEYGMDRPPDFLKDPLRSDDDDTDVHRSVAAGIGGTPMPAWTRRLPASDLWALVHYVRELQRRRGTPQAEALSRAAER